MSPELANPDATLEYVVPLSADATPTQELTDSTKPLSLPADRKPAASKTVIKLTQLGDFRLLAKLGQGGMGSVFKAEQMSRNRLVALKVMNKDLARKPGYIERFQQESRFMGRLNHPNLIKCYAAGESHGFVYLAMEFIDGGSLGDRLSKEKVLTPSEAVRIALGIAHGLKAAHEVGLVHRDIKPDNILMSSNGQPKISDLGLAKSNDDDSGLTQTGICVGTPFFASLEQIRDAKSADARADIYALGCVLYLMLVGTLPFEANSLLGMIKAKEKGTYELASVARPGTPASLDRIMTKCLAKSPDGRYSSCHELIEDLELTGLGNR
jgi:serine/threonine-protein kinase